MKETTLNPLALLLQSVDPNWVTVTALVPGILSAVFAAQMMYGWAVVMWVFNRTLDGLDGTIARLNQSQTDFGGYLDILVDFLIYAIIPIGIVLGQPTQLNWIALAVLLASFYVNSASWLYLSSILEKRGAGAKHSAEMTSVTMPTGIIEGTETVIGFSLFLLFPQFTAFLFFVFAALVSLTVVQRLVWARQELRG